MDTFLHLKQHPVVAILRRLPQQHTHAIIDALYEGGIRSVEITADSQGVCDIIAATKNKYPTMKVGAGTVLTVEEAQQVMASGADFVLSPVVNRAVIEAVVAEGRVMIPGAFTPTEAYDAYKLGAQIIKLFPAGLLGTKFMKDMAGPLPFIPLAPTGGVSEDNLLGYLQAGAHCVGISSAIPTNFEQIDQAAQQQIIEQARKLTTISQQFHGER